MEHACLAPSLDLCWAVVRMAAAGYWPATIEMLTAIPQPMIFQILRTHQATGQVVQPPPIAAPPPGYYYPAPQPWYGGPPPVLMAPPHFAPGAAPPPQMGVGQFGVAIHPPPVVCQNIPVFRQPAEIPQATIAEVREEVPWPRILAPSPKPPAPPLPRLRTATPPPTVYQPPAPPEPSRPPQPSAIPRSSAPSKHVTSLKRATAQKPYPTSKPPGAKKSEAMLKAINTSNPVKVPRAATPPDVALHRKKIMEWRAKAELYGVKTLCDDIDLLRQNSTATRDASRAGQPRAGPQMISSATLMDLAPLAPAVKPEPGGTVLEAEISRKISKDDVEHLRHYLSDRPAAEFRELCDELLQRNVSISPFQLFRTFRQHKVKKRMDNHWYKGDRVTREQFAFKIGEFSYRNLIFIAQFPWDVTYRWAIPGRKQQEWARAQKFIISFALSSNGIEFADISERPANPDYESVVDHTMWRTGQSVFILNKHQMQDKDSLKDSFRVWGKQYFFLPPSSSDYSPTKLAKAWIKEEIERREVELAGAVDMPMPVVRNIVEAVVKSITGEQARVWLKQCNYM